MDYNPKFRFAPSAKPRCVGVHPHRGFEAVTIAYKGRIAHHDSSGSSGVIDEGGVQWMTAGSGILHKEYHEEQFSQTGSEPLNEPIAARGPFAMNTREELAHAYEDFNLGRFGYLED